MQKDRKMAPTEVTIVVIIGIEEIEEIEMVVIMGKTEDTIMKGMMITVNQQPKKMLRHSVSTSATAVVHQSL